MYQSIEVHCFSLSCIRPHILTYKPLMQRIKEAFANKDYQTAYDLLNEVRVSFVLARNKHAEKRNRLSRATQAILSSMILGVSLH